MENKNTQHLICNNKQLHWCGLALFLSKQNFHLIILVVWGQTQEIRGSICRALNEIQPDNLFLLRICENGDISTGTFQRNLMSKLINNCNMSNNV